ncbi:MAG TPA: HEAT repeat domain-containing protein [Planctomycetota bacterium]|nr:HEAT repeat domain-containing protein [Planctomycetota bacterium]
MNRTAIRHGCALLLAFVAAPDALDEALAAFRERMVSAPGVKERELAVHEIALHRDPRVAAALKPLLSHADLEVRVAAAATIGEQKDPSILPALVLLLEKEDDQKEPSRPFLAALAEGIGECEPKAGYKPVQKLARKWIDLDPDVARPAARAMGRVRNPQAVEDLLDLLERSESMRLSQTSDAWKNAYDFTSEFLAGELRTVTGKDIRNTKSWRDWWRQNKRSWKPPAEGEGVATTESGDEWSDPAGKYSLRRPGPGWAWQEAKYADVVAERRSEGRFVARIWVKSEVAGNLASQTPAAAAEEWRPRLEKYWKEIRPDRTRWGAKIRFAGEPAVMHDVHGRHPDHGICTERTIFVLRKGVLFRVVATCLAAPGEPIWLEWETFLESFRFAKK